MASVPERGCFLVLVAFAVSVGISISVWSPAFEGSPVKHAGRVVQGQFFYARQAAARSGVPHTLRLLALPDDRLAVYVICSPGAGGAAASHPACSRRIELPLKAEVSATWGPHAAGGRDLLIEFAFSPGGFCSATFPPSANAEAPPAPAVIFREVDSSSELEMLVNAGGGKIQQMIFRVKR